MTPFLVGSLLMIQIKTRQRQQFRCREGIAAVMVQAGERPFLGRQIADALLLRLGIVFLVVNDKGGADFSSGVASGSVRFTPCGAFAPRHSIL
jgi:hypothetical protein